MVKSKRRALLSVTDKTGLVEFAKGLSEVGFEILSTGGTARVLQQAGVNIVPLADFTGLPEMLDGRVKTLHPRVHAGILADRDNPDHMKVMENEGYSFIDLVCVNLYDFAGALTEGLDGKKLLEHIDIGGPTMLRASAKNHPHVLTVVDPSDYEDVLDRVRRDETPLDFRKKLAAKVFARTAAYDQLITRALETESAFPRVYNLSSERQALLRYGENPHQEAAFYVKAGERGLNEAVQHQGKALSYNNLLDLDSALGLSIDLGGVNAVFIKHNNPCGAAYGASPEEALRRARDCDALSAFGAVVAVNQEVDEGTAVALTESFVEAIVAPSFSAAALTVLKKKKNLRVLELNVAAWEAKAYLGALEERRIRGGFLVQTRDQHASLVEEVDKANVVTKTVPDQAQRRALSLAWIVAKHVRSNAIVFAGEDSVVAVGAGQMSRVDAVKLCVLKAGERLKGTVAASDAFFPFRDGVDVLAEAGATAIVQPGGSIRDEEVIEAANHHALSMLFTKVRHFRH